MESNFHFLEVTKELIHSRENVTDTAVTVSDL